MKSSEIRLGILQRVLPDYRVPFFDLLAERFPKGVCVAAGQPRAEEHINSGTLEKSRFYQLENIHILQGRLYLCLQDHVMDWLEEWKPDVLIMEANPRYIATPKAIRWMHWRNRPVIGWGLGAAGGGGLRALWRKQLIDQFDALLTYSRNGKEQYIAAGIEPQKVFIAPNAASIRPVGEPPIRGAGFRDGRGEVIFVGRLQARKRVDLLLQACAEIPEQMQPRLTVVGDGPEKEALLSLAARIYPRAEFTGDRRGTDLQTLFHRADLFVLPGTGGLALQQAMGFALPAIAAEGDGTQADLVRPENGWLVEPGSLESLKACLMQALQNPIELRKKGLESFRIVRDEINLERMADGFVEAVEYVSRGEQP
jgi:glycosyltransferase involved in cell wall biosynthesis